MKKLLSVMLILAALMTLVGCNRSKNKEYKPVESTEEESRVIATLSIDGTEYSVKYELYRAFFLSLKHSVDGGDASIWSGDNSSEYINEINEQIFDRIIDIYSSFALCRRIGYDIYSSKVDNRIKDTIRVSVDGGDYDGSHYQGFGGDYEKYLETLKAMNLNYSVQALLIRYEIAKEAIEDYYIGTRDAEDITADESVGTLEYNREDVYNFYISDSTKRIFTAILNTQAFTEADASNTMLDIKAAADIQKAQDEKEADIMDIIRGKCSYSPIELDYVIGRYSHTETDAKISDCAASLSFGETSGVLRITTSLLDAYYIIYIAEKTDEYFDARYGTIELCYLQNEMGKIKSEVNKSAEDSLAFTDIYHSLVHKDIRM